MKHFIFATVHVGLQGQLIKALNACAEAGFTVATVQAEMVALEGTRLTSKNGMPEVTTVYNVYAAATEEAYLEYYNLPYDQEHWEQVVTQGRKR
jgi:hypothetical protein